MALTATVSLSALVATDNVTDRTVYVAVNGTAIAPIDAFSSPATFPCNYGDSIAVYDIDTNAAGPSAPSPTFTITAPPAPASVPTTPAVLGVTFA